MPLRGAAARIVEAMEASREVPTATSVRTVPARLLEVNRSVLNGHLRRRQGGKVSFTHMIAYAVVKALEAVPVMTTMYREVDGKPNAARPAHVNLGLAVDTRRPDGSRTLLVPNIKQADTLDFAGFVRAYEELIGKVRANKLTVPDFADTTVTLTNPGTIGTVLSVPRLMAGQSAIIGVGAIDFPAEYQGADPDTLADIGIGKVITLTSTYDHRVIQGAESGEFLAAHAPAAAGRGRLLRRAVPAIDRPVRARAVAQGREARPGLAGEHREAGPRAPADQHVPGPGPPDRQPGPAQGQAAPDAPRAGPGQLRLHHLGPGAALRHRRAGRAERELPLGEILHILRDAYCRTGTSSTCTTPTPTRSSGSRSRSRASPRSCPRRTSSSILHKLNEAEAFERFLHTKYIGHKRFSLEGGREPDPHAGRGPR